VAGVAVVVRVGQMSVGVAIVVVVVAVGVRPVPLGMLVGVPVGVGVPASGHRGAGSADVGLTGSDVRPRINGPSLLRLRASRLERRDS